MPLKRLIYLSVASDGLSSVDVTDILAASKRNNPARGITGLLVFTGKHFIQTVEGESDELDRLIDKISKDTRHHDFEIITEGSIQKRLFTDWAMGYSKASEEGLSERLMLDGALTPEGLAAKLDANSTFTTNFLRGLIGTK